MAAHRDAARHPWTEPGVQADSSVARRLTCASRFSVGHLSPDGTDELVRWGELPDLGVTRKARDDRGHVMLSLDGCFEGRDLDLSRPGGDEELHAHVDRVAPGSAAVAGTAATRGALFTP